MSDNTEFRAKQAQSDPKKMVRIWENSLKAGYDKISKEPDKGKRERMENQLEFGKARLEYYKKKI